MSGSAQEVGECTEPDRERRDPSELLFLYERALRKNLYDYARSLYEEISCRLWSLEELRENKPEERLHRAADLLDEIEALCDEATVNLQNGRARDVGLHAVEHDIPGACDELRAVLEGRDDG